MTLGKLIKRLQLIESKFGSRKNVVVDLREAREIGDEFTHWSVLTVSDETIPWAKDDNFELADGSQRTRHVVVIGL